MIPLQLTIWDVFLLDTEFKIERAKRYYRQRLHFLHPEDDTEQGHQAASVRTTGTISRISKKVFNSILLRSKSAEAVTTAPSNSLHHVESSSGGSDESRSPSPPSAMLDPSTNVNPLGPAPAPGDEEQDQQEQEQEQLEQDKKRRKKRTTDVSKHTLYIENSQMRLKLFARSEVCEFFTYECVHLIFATAPNAPVDHGSGEDCC
jgi:phospholipase D1/2